MFSTIRVLCVALTNYIFVTSQMVEFSQKTKLMLNFCTLNDIPQIMRPNSVAVNQIWIFKYVWWTCNIYSDIHLQWHQTTDAYIYWILLIQFWSSVNLFTILFLVVYIPFNFVNGSDGILITAFVSTVITITTVISPPHFFSPPLFCVSV